MGVGSLGERGPGRTAHQSATDSADAPVQHSIGCVDIQVNSNYSCTHSHLAPCTAVAIEAVWVCRRLGAGCTHSLARHVALDPAAQIHCMSAAQHIRPCTLPYKCFTMRCSDRRTASYTRHEFTAEQGMRTERSTLVNVAVALQSLRAPTRQRLWHQ